MCDPSGGLYGTALEGGAYSAGVVFRWDAGGETMLNSFTGGADGKYSDAGVIRDSAGNIYGATPNGGGAGGGIVYELDRAGRETVLYHFTGGADGGDPGGVIRDSAGNLYGVTITGGASGDRRCVRAVYRGPRDGSLQLSRRCLCHFRRDSRYGGRSVRYRRRRYETGRLRLQIDDAVNGAEDVGVQIARWEG